MADSFELHLIYATDTKIVRWLKTKSEATPFDERFTEYLRTETQENVSGNQWKKEIKCTVQNAEGICPHCGRITYHSGTGFPNPCRVE